jgi:hypothetical protein
MDFYNNNNLFRKAFLLLITPVLFFSINISLAQAETGVPSILSYQGRLTDSGGNLLGGAGTPYFFKFSFWDSATVGSGSQVWPIVGPSPVSLTVKQGVFNVNIGDIENSYPDILNYNFGSNKNIYLQVEASANNSSFETLSPRQRITSAPFAEVAASLAPDYLTSIFSNYFTKTESNNLYDFLGTASTTASATIANHENIFNHNLISTALQTESDPVWSAASTTLSVSNFATSSISQWLNDSGYLTSFTETDPLFIAWDKNSGISITESQISDLKSYLTGESDTLATITARGASTSVESTFSGGLVTNKIRPATDSSTAVQITKADGITSVLNIDTTNGNVGIGTSTPIYPLSINATSSYNTGLSITGNINSFFQGNIQNTNSSAGASSDLVATADNGNDTTHYIDMGINNSGGGISPFANANETYLYSASDSLNIGALGTGSIIKFYTGGNNTTPAITFDSVGNVVIGTSTDPALLTVSDGISVLGYGGGQIAGIGQYGNRIGSLSLKANASTKVFLTSSGNSWISGGSLGIGTTVPTANFQVAQVTDGVGKVSNSAGGSTVTGVGTFFTNIFKVGDTITINSTSLTETRTIDTIISDTSLTTTAPWTNTNSSRTYTLSGGTRFSVLGNGNVGIGTTTPSQVLSVVGNAQFTAVGSGASANDLRITDDGTLTTSASDISLKMNLVPLNISSTSVSVLDKVIGLKPYTYNWKSDPDGIRDIGLIAQDVENIFPEITFTNKTDGYKGINYSRLPVILISAIQELNNKLIQAGSYVVDGVASFVSIITDKFLANEADIKNIKTQQVCIGETCLDEVMLKEIILKNSIIDTGSNIEDPVIPPTGTSTATTSTTTTDIVASTTEIIASTTEETASEATSTDQVVQSPVIEETAVDPAVVVPIEPAIEIPPAPETNI